MISILRSITLLISWNYKSNAFGVVDNNGDPIQPYLNAVGKRMAFKVIEF